MHYRVRYSLDFDLKIRSGQVCSTSCSNFLSAQFLFDISNFIVRIINQIIESKSSFSADISYKEYFNTRLIIVVKVLVPLPHDLLVRPLK